ncbi:MAG: hypothetical protein WA648_09925, partial [Methylocella sp.]
PSFDLPALPLRLVSIVSKYYARRPLGFGVSGRALFTLLAGRADARSDRPASTASLANAKRRILAAFRQKIELSSGSNLPSQLSLKHAN